MAALRHPRFCSRYLSPCRHQHTLLPHSRTEYLSTHNGINHSSSSFTERGRAMLRSRDLDVTGRDRRRTSSFTPRGSTSSIYSTSRSTSPNRESVHGLTTRYLDKLKKLQTTSIADVGSLLKIVSTLNIDLPQGLQNYIRLPNWSTNKRDKDKLSKTVDGSASVSTASQEWFSEDRQKKEEPLRAVITPAETNPETAADIGKTNIGKRNLTADVFQREQHDFVQAMTEKDSSIRNYYSNIVMPNSMEIRRQTSSPGVTKTEPDHNMTQVTTVNSPVPPGDSHVTVSILKQISNYLPRLPTMGSKSKTAAAKASGKQDPKAGKQKALMAVRERRSAVDKKTRGLVMALRKATSSASRLIRMEELCRYLIQHPDAKYMAVKEKATPCLLRLRLDRDEAIREQAMEALALVGHVNPVKGRGINVLTLDGGGTRGLVTIEMLRQLEVLCQKPLYEIFDYIGGVSTGSLVAIMIAVHKLNLDDAENLYKTFSKEMFERHKLTGVSKLVMSHAYYDSALWEKILRENIGLSSFLDSTRDPATPKIGAVSSLINVTRLSNFLFRNYNLPSGAQSQYPGSCKYKLWEAIRASSAAPGYYEDLKLDDFVHQDGGVLTNNPTAIAIHECKLLWPKESLQCVVSIGTGRYEPAFEPQNVDSGLKSKLFKIIQSATDTEAVHTMLHDLLPPSTYFRFNPYMSEDLQLDEIRPDKWDKMEYDTLMYCRKNEHKLLKAKERLLLTKLPRQKAADWLKLRADMIG